MLTYTYRTTVGNHSTRARDVGGSCYTGPMPPLTLSVPACQGDAIAAQVTHTPDFAGAADPLVQVWIGPNLELLITVPMADRLADALIDALAIDADQPVLSAAGPDVWH